MRMNEIIIVVGIGIFMFGVMFFNKYDKVNLIYG